MIRTATTSLLLMMSVSGAAAQQGVRVGVGMGLQQSAVVLVEEPAATAVTVPQIYVPVVLGRLTIEPGIGLYRFSEEAEDGFSSFAANALRLSVGGLLTIARHDRGQVYAGPRLGILRLRSRYELDGEPTDYRRTDLFVSGVLGGEGFVTPAFSLGGEASLDFLRLGDSEYEPDPGIEDEFDQSLISIGAEFRVRWYIN